MKARERKNFISRIGILNSFNFMDKTIFILKHDFEQTAVI
jgi:hypothetical protein